MTAAKPAADPAITSARVMYRRVAEIGTRVRHYAQRYTPWATATVVGFYKQPGHDWIRVLVEPDRPGNRDGLQAGDWDWDRTIVESDPPWCDGVDARGDGS